jgi:hypothetical protein
LEGITAFFWAGGHRAYSVPGKIPSHYVPGRTPQAKAKKETHMNMNVTLAPLISLIAGILILVVPRLLNYIVAVYLIAIGVIGLFGGSFNIR